MMTPTQDAGQDTGQDAGQQDEQGFAQVRTEDIDAMSYEQAREELVSVVQKLETGGVPLEESLALWQRGEALADRCERWLDGARTRLEEVRRSLDADAAPDAGEH